MAIALPSVLPVLKRSAVVHTVLGFLALAALYASRLPQFAPYADVISGICALLGLGTVAAARAYLPPAVQAVLNELTPVSAPKGPTAGEIVAAKGGPVMFLPFLLVGLAMAGCASLPPLPVPSPAAYAASFKACLTNEGLADASPEVAKIWQILDTGGTSAQAIEAAVENAALTLTADTAAVVVSCAVDAWLANNPIPAGAKPTPSQAAVRLFHAKHLRRPTALYSGAR